jgi:hypothetical protein
LGLGKEMAQETERRVKMVGHPVVAEYLSRLVQVPLDFPGVGSVIQESTPRSNETRATRFTPNMLIAILAGMAAAAMLFAIVTGLRVLYHLRRQHRVPRLPNFEAEVRLVCIDRAGGSARTGTEKTVLVRDPNHRSASRQARGTSRRRGAVAARSGSLSPGEQHPYRKLTDSLY